MEANFACIPLHIVEDILLKLDCGSLFQCSLVCQHWSDLITSPDFIFRRSERTFGSKNQILVIKACHCEAKIEIYEREYIHFPHCRVTYSLHWDNDQFDLFHKMERPDIDDFKGTELIGVSNGLVCLASILPFKFMFWNPTIRRYVWLPLTMTWDEKVFSVGFGYDRVNNDFKVVNLIFHYPSVAYYMIHEFDSAWVFSYVTWSWKRLTCNILYSCSIHSGSPRVLFNGVLHWIARHDEENYDFILTFDISREVFGQILLPNDIEVRHFCFNYIVTTGDSFLFIQSENVYDEGYNNEEEEDEEEVSYSFSIWTMEQYGNHESWTKLSSSMIRRSKIAPEQILGARKNGDFILEMEGGQIRRYNSVEATNIGVEALQNSVFFCYYTDSLYLLERREDVNSY